MRRLHTGWVLDTLRSDGAGGGRQVDFGSSVSIGLSDEGADPDESADIVAFPYGAAAEQDK